MKELKELLEQLNIPVAYSHFNTATNPPFITYRRASSSNFGADNKVYKKINNFYVELYTEYKDLELEQGLEDLFDSKDIFYDVESEDYIDTEQMYQVIYAITIEVEDEEISI